MPQSAAKSRSPKAGRATAGCEAMADVAARPAADSIRATKAAAALRLQRSCGLRIGEALDLELEVRAPTRPRQLAEGPARLARHRADGPARRRDPRADRPDHRDPQPRTPATAPPLPPARAVPVHPPPTTALAQPGP